MARLNPKREMPLRLTAAFLLWALLAACRSPNSPPNPTLSPLETRGRSVFDSTCSRCHGRSGETVIVGPSLAGIATRGGSRIEGMDAPTYIRNSILSPNAYVVEGFAEGLMPENLKDQLSTQDVDAVVAYLLTLK